MFEGEILFWFLENCVFALATLIEKAVFGNKVFDIPNVSLFFFRLCHVLLCSHAAIVGTAQKEPKR